MANDRDELVGITPGRWRRDVAVWLVLVLALLAMAFGGFAWIVASGTSPDDRSGVQQADPSTDAIPADGAPLDEPPP